MLSRAHLPLIREDILIRQLNEISVGLVWKHLQNNKIPL